MAAPAPKNFSGSWETRLHGLTECGVDFSGKRILDVGCNMGIIAYEIAKSRPAFIHGIDISPEHIGIARSIFQAVLVPHRFEYMDLTSSDLRKAIDSRYEIMLLLGVYHHVKATAGTDLAQTMLRMLAEKVSTILVRDPGSTEEEIFCLLAGFGFSVLFQSNRPADAGRLSVLVRIGPDC